MNKSHAVFIVLAGLLCESVLPLRAAMPVAVPAAASNSAAGLEFYEKKVRPALNQYCYKCHSQNADKLKGGLYLDSREGMLHGGESGPAITLGQPEHSLLIEAIRYTNADTQMPPKGRLPDSVVADLTRWVQMGAPAPVDPKAARGTVVSAPVVPGVLHNIHGVEYSKLRQEHWAWQPIRVSPPPAVRSADWPRTDIDRFVLAGLEAKQMHPVGDADRVTLIRRVSFDLVGLPPTPAQVQAFVADPSPDAFAKVVDRLLASPAFGERWGRHWLDVARFAESTGSSRNVPYSYAWRYRDYVIDAFNQDKPYNQFITEQLAGDLLPASSSGQRDQQTIATGFLALGVKDLNEKDRLKYTMDNVDEQIDVMSRSMLGLTVGCARCHDHKFDPIPTADYYSLAGIFKSTRILAGVQGRKGGMGKGFDAPQLLAHVTGGRYEPTPRPISTQSAAAAALPVAVRPVSPGVVEADAAPRKTSARAIDLQTLNNQLETARNQLKLLRLNGTRDQIIAKRGEVLALLSRVGALEGSASPPAPDARASAEHPGKQQQPVATFAPTVAVPDSGDSFQPLAAPSIVLNVPAGPAMAVTDFGSPGDAQICIRGETENLGPAVPRGFISLVQMPATPAILPSHSGRLELAQWVTNPANPLTPRVMANRVWQHLFGEGLVRTVDNFGTSGEAPSNPQLLDYLANQFVTGGSSGDVWSVKQLIRKVVLSRSYQLASTYDAADAATDPADRLTWRLAPHRLEAEAMRDAMLACGGQLDASRPTQSPVQSIPVQELRKAGIDSSPDAPLANHRSVYLPVLRELVPPVLQLFDFAEPDMVNGDRQVTTVATQALYMMNDPFVMEQSRHLADRILSTSNLDENARVDLAYRLVLVRTCSAGERARAVQYLSAYARDDSSLAGAGPGRKTGGPRADAWASLCQALFCSAEFRYVN